MPRPWGWLRTRGLDVRPSGYPGVPGEWVAPPVERHAVLLYMHGGGFVSCSAATHRPITAGLARLTPAHVFAVDYRLAPEHRYPAALDDVMAAYACVLDDIGDPARVAVAGDSAGGNLVFGLMLRARDAGLPLPACAVALSPWLDLTGSSPSVGENNGRCAMFRPGNFAEFAAACTGSREPPAGYCAPLTLDLSSLPPVLLQVGKDELLRDDAVRAHELIRQADGDSTLEIYAGVFHGWHMLDGFVPEARQALAAAARFVGSHLKGHS